MTAHFAESASTLCRASARLLGWRPAEFWAATPAELACILAPDPKDPDQTAPLDRAGLNTLMERNPDG